jgi:hypothetical protein
MGVVLAYGQDMPTASVRDNVPITWISVRFWSSIGFIAVHEQDQKCRLDNTVDLIP